MIFRARGVPLLIGAYLAIALAWGMGGILLVPTVIQVEAGLIAIALHLVYVLTIKRWDALADTAPLSIDDSAQDRWINPTLFGFSFAFLAVAIKTAAVHDYLLHLNFWSVILNGMDPWYLENGFWGLQPPNAYGPLFNPLAILAWVNPLAPKLLFVSTYIFAATALTKRLGSACEKSWLSRIALLFWAWNPFAWVEIAIRGHFDVLVAWTCVLAIHARRQSRDFPCSLHLSIGILLKYIPFVLLPFLAINREQERKRGIDLFRFRLVAFTIALVAVGLGLSCLIWGPSTFRPLSFAATRSSTYLSIFRYLRGMHSPLPSLGIVADVDRWSPPLLGLALTVAWLWSVVRQPDPATSTTLAALVTLLLYRNGFPQYQIVPMMIASYWVAETWKQRRHRGLLALGLIGYFCWIMMFGVLYYRLGDSSQSFEDAVGLPTFLLGSFLVVCIIVSEPRHAELDSPRVSFAAVHSEA